MSALYEHKKAGFATCPSQAFSVRWTSLVGSRFFHHRPNGEKTNTYQLMRGQPNFAGSCETLFYSASLACLQSNVKSILPMQVHGLTHFWLIHSHRRQGYAESFVRAAPTA
jgi:hypothetical protein